MLVKDKNKNPLTPLTEVNLSQEEKERMWGNIMKSVDEENLHRVSGSAKSSRTPRRQTWQSLLAGGAAVVLLGGAWLGENEFHWFQGTSPVSLQSAQASPNGAVLQGAAKLPKDAVQSVAHLSHLHMFNATDGWAQMLWGNTFFILRTTDGGQTWKKIMWPTGKYGKVDLTHYIPTGQNEFASAYPNQTTTVLAMAVPRGNTGTKRVSDNILINSTHNPEKMWVASDITENLVGKYGQRPVAFDFINSKVGWLTTMPYDGGGEVFVRQGLYQTTDGGIHWHKVAQSNSTNNNALPKSSANPGDGWVAFLNTRVGFTLGEPSTQTDVRNNTKPSLYRTANGGKTWTKIALSFPPNSGYGGAAVHVLPPKAAGNFVFLPVVIKDSMYLFVSHDDGQTFRQVGGTTSVKGESGFTGQFGFWTNQRGWFWINGQLFETRDGGKSIQRIKGKSFDGVQWGASISWVNQRTAFVTGANALWKTTDGGRHWTEIPSKIVP